MVVVMVMMVVVVRVVMGTAGEMTMHVLRRHVFMFAMQPDTVREVRRAVRMRVMTSTVYVIARGVGVARPLAASGGVVRRASARHGVQDVRIPLVLGLEVHAFLFTPALLIASIVREADAERKLFALARALL